MATGGMPVFGQTEAGDIGGIVVGRPVDVHFEDEEDLAVSKPVSLQQASAVAIDAPASGTEKLQALFAVVRSRCSDHLAKTQPWKDFLTLSRADSKEEVQERIKTNVVRFYANYGLAFSVVVTLSVVQSTWCIFMGIFLAAAWCFFLHKTQDVAWDSVSIGGFQLNREQQRTVMAALSFVVFLFAAGQVILSTVAIFAAVVLVHSACHALPAPEASDDPERQPVHEIGEAEEPLHASG